MQARRAPDTQSSFILTYTTSFGRTYSARCGEQSLHIGLEAMRDSTIAFA